MPETYILAWASKTLAIADRMGEKLWHLSRCDLFERLSADQLSRLERRARVRQFPRNTPIYLPADAADGVLLLSAGRAKICGSTADGKQSILGFIEPGELFGELAILESGQRDEYAEAVEPSTVVLIPADEMQQLMEESPHLALGITKLFGLRRKRIERRLKYLLGRSSRERLVHLLLELAEQYGHRVPAGVWIKIKLSHQDLASLIGSTRETVTVVLGELQAEGCLVVGRQKIVLIKPERLAGMLQAAPPRIGPEKIAAPGGPASARYSWETPKSSPR